MSRICVFIDGSNLYFALKRNNKMTRVDYYQFSLALTGEKRKLIRTYYYNAVFDATGKHPRRLPLDPEYVRTLI